MKNDRKIGIVTIQHARYSYGAILQALATCLICQRFSDRVDIINYENRYEQKGVKNANTSFVGRLIRFFNYLVRMYLYGGYKNPYIDSSNIDKIYPSITNRCYHSISEMEELDYDILITGSDQVWNPIITGGIDPVFFLQFSNPQKRLSYASSMGSYELDDDEKIKVKKMLSKYNSISVRENFAKEQLSELYNGDIKVVMDPTLLLNREQWMDYFHIQAKPIKDSYILTFFVTSGIESYWVDIEKYIRYYKLPIWNVQSHRYKSSHVDRVISAPTVEEFLSLIDNAAVVITNSFHGTAFAVNFKKEFIPILAKKNPQRVINLLETIGLTDRINIPVEKLDSLINYEDVHDKLAFWREESLTWLDNSINN